MSEAEMKTTLENIRPSSRLLLVRAEAFHAPADLIPTRGLIMVIYNTFDSWHYRRKERVPITFEYVLKEKVPIVGSSELN